MDSFYYDFCENTQAVLYKKTPIRYKETIDERNRPISTKQNVSNAKFREEELPKFSIYPDLACIYTCINANDGFPTVPEKELRALRSKNLIYDQAKRVRKIKPKQKHWTFSMSETCSMTKRQIYKIFPSMIDATHCCLFPKIPWWISWARKLAVMQCSLGRHLKNCDINCIFFARSWIFKVKSTWDQRVKGYRKRQIWLSRSACSVVLCDYGILVWIFWK